MRHLPPEAPGHRSPGPSGSASPENARQPTILVVDDSEVVRFATSEILREAGFDIKEAATGAEALRGAAESPDAIILDVRLPDLDGYEVCRRLKADPATAAIPVLHLSGVYRGLEDRVRGLETGADAYLTAPAEPAELLATVRALLRLRRAEVRLRESEARRDAAEALAHVGRQLAESLQVDAVARRIVDSIRTVFRAQAASLYRLEPVSGDLVPLATSGSVGPAFEPSLVIPRGIGLAGFAVRERQPALTPDVLADPRILLSPEFQARLEQTPHRAVLVVPLVVDDRVIGTLGVADRAGRMFGDDEVRLTQAFAAQAAMALENARLYEEVRDTRDFLRSIAENAVDAIITTDEHGRMTYFSPGAEAMFGFSAADVLGRQTAEYCRGGLAEARAVMHRLRSEGRIRNYETAFRARDGGWVPISSSMSVLRGAGGAIVGTLGVVKDISERQQVEEALRESEARFRSAFEDAAVGMALQGADGRYLRVNRALCDMLGYADADLLTFTYSAITHPDDRSRDVECDRALLAEERHAFQMEKRYVHRHGHAVWVLATISPLRASDGSRHFLAQVQDITERKRGEQMRTDLEAQLRQAQKMEAVGRLAGGVAHDFNNLLTVIQGRSQLLLQRIPPDEPMRRHLDLIDKTAQRAASLTRQLLAFSRKQILQPRVLDLNIVVAGMERMLRRLIGEDIALDRVIGAALGSVRADPGQLEQVILNLAVNARDAMPQGGRLTLETGNVDVDVPRGDRRGGVPSGLYVRLAVIDTGVGMNAETQAHLFEPFFTTKEPGKGTGLGLATVYGITTQSGGFIDVISAPGRGTRVELYLPRIQTAPEPVDGDLAPRNIRRGSETILLVEDEDLVREFTREILELCGYTVLEARHPGEALLMGERHEGPLHLMVTDVVMPRMNGRELADRLAPLRPHMRVLYVSGYTADAIAQHGVLESGRAFLPKPFTADALAQKVRELLSTIPDSAP